MSQAVTAVGASPHAGVGAPSPAAPPPAAGHSPDPRSHPIARLTVPTIAEQVPDAMRVRRELPAPSAAEGPWEADWGQAAYNARIALQSIDWSRDEIVIWVPGTGSGGVHQAFEGAVRAAWAGAGGTSLVALAYPASWDLRTSVATGIATLRLVLEEINRRGLGHRVLLAGESQGAWVIGEAIADPALAGAFQRAVLMGHPALAAHHYTAAAQARLGERVIELNNPGDHVAMPIRGDLTVALDAMQSIYQRRPQGLPSVLRAVAANPTQAGRLAIAGIRALLPGNFLADPHDYTSHMTMAVDFLRTGRIPWNP